MRQVQRRSDRNTFEIWAAVSLAVRKAVPTLSLTTHTMCGCSIWRSLKDEPDKRFVVWELFHAEGASRVKGAGATRQRRFTPVRCRGLWADVAARHEGVRRWPCVHTEPWLAPQRQRHVQASRPTQRALPLLVSFPCSLHDVLVVLLLLLLVFDGSPSAPPRVEAVHMAAAQVGPGLPRLMGFGLVLAGEGQSVHQDRAVWTRSVQLHPQLLQVFRSRSARECGRRAPQQRHAAQVDQRAVHQHLRLVTYLQRDRKKERGRKTDIKGIDGKGRL